jgi:cytochrome bd ubiquinol oxidase subunit I
MVVYLIMYPTGILLMARVVRAGPLETAPAPIESGRPAGPVEALPHAEEAIR